MTKALAAALLATLLLPATACGDVPNEAIRTVSGDSIEVTEVAGGLQHPWGMAFLPDGRILLTERPGRLRLIEPDGRLREQALAGVPSVFASGQGGLLDIVLDPDFETNRLIWLSFAEAGAGGMAGTAVGHGRFVNAALEGFEVVWRMQDKVPGNNHFGSRIVFADDDTLFITTGERFRFEPAQDLSQTLGKVVRITREGAPAPGNPFLDREDVLPEIYSYGHRNIQAAAIDPATGALYVAEMGPKGGDELNRIEPGANYGWPLVSWGTHYDGTDIPDPPTRPEFKDALIQWTPVIAPSGMIFYQGDLFADFKGDALIGGLRAKGLTRLALQEGAVVEQELIPLGARIREVAEGPDGALYVLTDDASDGAVWKLAPLAASN
jgi:glucose/arabinose dehydrogenase